MFQQSVLGWIEALTFWKWLVIGLALLGVEVATGASYAFWLGLAALVTGVVAWGLAFDWRFQIVVFAAFAALFIALGRRVFPPNGNGAGQASRE